MRTRGFTLLELFILLGIVAVIAAVVIPSLTLAYKHGSEPGAIATLRTIAGAQTLHRRIHGRFADLRGLAAAGLLEPALADGARQGYRFVAAPSTRSPHLRWFATATPALPGATGDRSFAVNHDATIFCTLGPDVGRIAADTCAIPSSALPIGK